jgi:hypothetical protein
MQKSALSLTHLAREEALDIIKEYYSQHDGLRKYFDCDAALFVASPAPVLGLAAILLLLQTAVVY